MKLSRCSDPQAPFFSLGLGCAHHPPEHLWWLFWLLLSKTPRSDFMPTEHFRGITQAPAMFRESQLPVPVSLEPGCPTEC